jgi:hypothetical protein
VVLVNAAIVAKCANAMSYTTVSSSTGGYSLDVPATAVPCLIQATGQDGTVWRTVAVGGGSTAITPITELVVAKLLKASPADAFAAYPSPAAVALLTSANVAAAQTDVRTALNGISDLSAIPDFIATPFRAATATTTGDAIDQAIDALTAALQAKGSSTQMAASALAQGKTVSSTFGSSGTIRAAQVPTTGYTLAEGLNKFRDVWAVSGTIVVAGNGLAVSEDNGNSWSGIAQVVAEGRSAIGPGVILYGGGSGSLSRHVRTGPGVWTKEVLTSLKFVHPTLGAPFFLNIQSLAYFESNFYASVGSDYLVPASVYKSSDGVSWAKLSRGFYALCNLRDMFRSADGTLKYCGTVSTDNGVSWTNDLLGSAYKHLVIAGTEVAINPNTKELYQSTGNGTTFLPVESNLANVTGVNAIGHIAAIGTDMVVVYTESSAAGARTIRIIRSSDKGKTWVASEAGFAGSGLFTSEIQHSMSVVGNEVYLSAFTTGDKLGFESYLYQSHDGGKNWFVALKAESWSNRNLWSQGGQCYRNDFWLASGVFHERTQRSSDGLLWVAAEQAVPVDDLGTQLRTVSVDAGSSNSVVTAGSATVEKFDAKAGVWRTVYASPTTGWVTPPTGIGGALYVGVSAPAKLLKSTDQGETWQAVPNATIPAYNIEIKALANGTLLAVNWPKPCINRCAVFPGFQEGVFISKDEGVTWKQIPEFGVPRSVAVGNGVVIGSRANGATGLVRLGAPYTNATSVEPSFGATTDYLYKTVMFEANNFWFSDTGGKLRMSGDGNSWQTVQLDVTDAITGVAICGNRLVMKTNTNGTTVLLASPAALP